MRARMKQTAKARMKDATRQTHTVHSRNLDY